MPNHRFVTQDVCVWRRIAGASRAGRGRQSQPRRVARRHLGRDRHGINPSAGGTKGSGRLVSQPATWAGQYLDARTPNRIPPHRHTLSPTYRKIEIFLLYLLSIVFDGPTLRLDERRTYPSKQRRKSGLMPNPLDAPDAATPSRARAFMLAQPSVYVRVSSKTILETDLWPFP